MKRLILSITILAAMLTMAAQTATPKYIFYFIGDGMGNGHVMSTWYYNRTVQRMEQPLLMTTFPVAGVCSTYSASSPVTDSAAAGTALATGTKTRNNMLGMSPDTVPLTSVARHLHDAGFGVGILTTVAADDATPGAFYAHQPSRKNYYEIGVEAARSGYEFIAGAGLRGFVDKDGKPTDLRKQFADNDVTIVRGVDTLHNVDSRRVVLLNTDSVTNWSVPHTIDSIAGQLTLPVMTRECLDHLTRVSPHRFFMMVEGGNIDYAGHANDGGTVIKEIIKFDEALRIAYDFYMAHPEETLIVVTADHDTGGMSMGNQYLHYDAHLQHIDAQRISKDRMSDEVKAMLKSRRTYTWEDMREYLERNLGFWTQVPLTEAQTKELHQSFINTFERRDGMEQTALYNKYPGFVADVFKTLQDICGIGWTTTNHTGNPVHVYACGVGADRFASFNDNTQIPAKIMEIVFENDRVTE